MPCGILKVAAEGDSYLEGRCFFYDTVTMWVFGPLFVSEEKAEAFWNYLGDDPRKFDSVEMDKKWGEFCKLPEGS